MKWILSNSDYKKEKVLYNFIFAKYWGYNCNPWAAPLKYFFFIISDSGLTLSSTEAIAFGEFAELRCTENDTVTNDGFVTKLKCLPNGKFQTRKWNDNKCRERKICSKSPPRPPADFGLARNYSRDVKEFGYAEYNCISSHQVNASTYL